MFSLLVKEVMDKDRALCLPPETTVSNAAKLMAHKKTGAAMVVEAGQLIGIFTERDSLFRVTAKDRDPTTTRVSEVMTPEPITIGPNKSYGFALVLMQEHNFRHVPVVEDGQILGILSSRNAMDPDLEEFQAESNRREFIRAHG